MKLSLQKISRLACLVLCAGAGPAEINLKTVTPREPQP
jgi:hypothetical protein